MVIDGYSISGYFVITYWWLLMVLVLVAIGGYSINGYWWMLVVINVIILMGIGVYSVVNH